MKVVVLAGDPKKSVWKLDFQIAMLTKYSTATTAAPSAGMPYAIIVVLRSGVHDHKYDPTATPRKRYAAKGASGNMLHCVKPMYGASGIGIHHAFARSDAHGVTSNTAPAARAAEVSQVVPLEK